MLPWPSLAPLPAWSNKLPYGPAYPKYFQVLLELHATAIIDAWLNLSGCSKAGLSRVVSCHLLACRSSSRGHADSASGQLKTVQCPCREDTDSTSGQSEALATDARRSSGRCTKGSCSWRGCYRSSHSYWQGRGLPGLLERQCPSGTPAHLQDDWVRCKPVLHPYKGVVSLLVNKKHAIATSFHMAGMLHTLQHIV